MKNICHGTEFGSASIKAVTIGSSFMEFGHMAEQEQKIVLLDGVGDVLFQALLLDDVEYAGNELSASLHTIYCLNEKR